MNEFVEATAISSQDEREYKMFIRRDTIQAVSVFDAHDIRVTVDWLDGNRNELRLSSLEDFLDG